MRYAAIAILASAFGLFARPALAQTALPCPPLFTLSGSAPVVLPARFTTDGIAIAATIAGRTYEFTLDTGASTSAIDPGTAHALGLTSTHKTTVRGVRSEIAGGTYDRSFTRVAEMTVGPLSLHDVPLEEIPMDKVNTDDGVVGLLGCNFIAGSVVAIDLNAGTVTLYPSATFDPDKAGAVAQMPISLRYGVPLMLASIENVPGTFLVDTGNFTSMVYRSYLNQLPSFVAAVGSMAFAGIGGAASSSVYDVKDLRFGPFHVLNLPVIVPSQPTSNPMWDGILGRNTLANSILFLDYQRGLIYFKPDIE